MNKRALIVSIILFIALFALTLYACSLDSKKATPPKASAEPAVSAESTDIGDTPSDSPAPEPAPTPTAEPTPEVERITPRNRELVRVSEFIPDIVVELRYASDNNFTGKPVYDFSEAWLRYGTVKRLMGVQNALRERGYGLKIWDAYRPGAAQYTLWEAMPDGNFVANPYTGHSSHSSGGTVDITIIDSNGRELEMPSGFDEFSAAADRDYSDVSESAAENARILEQLMTDAGFSAYYGEWWHFADMDGYTYDELESIVLPYNIAQLYEPECEEYISLRAAPDYSAEVLEKILKGERFTLLGWLDDFARVEYNGRQGYVARAYIKIVDN